MAEMKQDLVVVTIDPTGDLKADRKVFDRAAHLIVWVEHHLAFSVEVVRQSPKKSARRLWLDPDLAESITVWFRHSHAATAFEKAMAHPAFQTFILGPRQSYDVVSFSRERAISDASQACREHHSIAIRYLADLSEACAQELADSKRNADQLSLKALEQIIAQLPALGSPADVGSRPNASDCEGPDQQTPAPEVGAAGSPTGVHEAPTT